MPPFFFWLQDGWCPLHAAAQEGFLSIVTLLINNKVNKIDPCDSDGETPLMRAVEGSHLPIVKYLLAKGADPNAMDKVRYLEVSSFSFRVFPFYLT